MGVPRISRWIVGYSQKTESVVVRYQLASVWTQQRLQELFEVPVDEPMYDAYLLDERRARIIGEEIGQDLLVPELDFFLEADAEPESKQT